MKSGIYQIINSFNGKSYIGSSINVEKRWTDHRRMLNRGCHPNIHLQRAWDKSKDKFILVILARCPNEYLIKLEQWFLDNTKGLYNIQLKADSSLGRILSDETKKKISEKSKLHRHSKETKERISKGLIGNKRSVGRKISPLSVAKIQEHPGTQANYRAMRKKVGQFDRNNNLIKVFDSITECCKELGLDQGTVSNVCLGRLGYKTCKGFKFKFI